MSPSTKRKNWSKEAMCRAVRFVRIGVMGYLRVSKYFSLSRAVMGKLRPAGQTLPPERFYPARDMIPNLTNEKNRLTDEDLTSLLRISASQFEPYYEKLLEIQSQFHSSHSPS
jgi:hypothetical protein